MRLLAQRWRWPTPPNTVTKHFKDQLNCDLLGDRTALEFGTVLMLHRLLLQIALVEGALRDRAIGPHPRRVDIPVDGDDNFYNILVRMEQMEKAIATLSSCSATWEALDHCTAALSAQGAWWPSPSGVFPTWFDSAHLAQSNSFDHDIEQLSILMATLMLLLACCSMRTVPLGKHVELFLALGTTALAPVRTLVGYGRLCTAIVRIPQGSTMILQAQWLRLLPLLDIWLLDLPLVISNEPLACQLRLKFALRPFGTGAATPLRVCLKLSFPVFVNSQRVAIPMPNVIEALRRLVCTPSGALDFSWLKVLEVVDTMALSLACTGTLSLLVLWALLLTRVLLRVLPLLITLSLSFFRQLEMLLAFSLLFSFLQGFCLMEEALLRILPLLVTLSLCILLHSTMLRAYSLYFNPLPCLSLTSSELLQVLQLMIPLGVHMSLLRDILLHLMALGGLPLMALRSYFLNKGLMTPTLMTKGALSVHADILIMGGVSDSITADPDFTPFDHEPVDAYGDGPTFVVPADAAGSPHCRAPVLAALEAMGAFGAGLRRHRAMFSSTAEGRGSMVRQLQPALHLEGHSEVVGALKGKTPNVRLVGSDEWPTLREAAVLP
ncbi:unnamed protein product [Prorocentrum cordatum]|uniref:Uncharacterized protein n=1 Tax=Prorocentrum cordatum TaxID=2364126 RepID=A0ABN9R0K0_9DINO|nr:unnamed protein product [Polarella glacialis]